MHPLGTNITMGDKVPLTDAQNKLEDLSGITLKPGENPYAAFIGACHDNHEEIQQLYAVHRTKRNAQQKDKFLSPGFGGLAIDQHLLKLERPHIEPGFRDERNCLVLWARPPIHVIQLAEKLQSMLKAAAPGMMPQLGHLRRAATNID
ncbi:high-affinity methionine permease [Purpureocillium lavendulum]|uniref:High-affinity methionine permease n=1 Tax=Purpureocillium lavendulum TaxID=1247861 RepID=A0AB34FWY9_9HYPO|nr:high-affinity methionine permease [Purpureocillium lavendulum]